MADGAPYINLATFCSNLSQTCCSGWRLRLLTGLIRLWLTNHFASEETIQDEQLQSRVWTPDETTNIQIESFARWRPTTTEKRPACIIKRGSVKVLREGINDRQMMTMGLSATKQRYTCFLQGSHVIYCIARESGEAEILADEVHRELLQFAVVLRPAMALHKLLVLEIGDLSILEEASQNFVIPITLAWAFEESWEIEPEAPLINTIDLSILTQ